MKSLIIFFIVVCYQTVAERDSYSYYKFTGPVSGQIEEVYVDGGTAENPEKHHVDFIAKPDYTYSYGVDDPHSGTSQAHKEARQGDTVLGEYRVVQPDGFVRIVRYVADPVNGFQVDIKYIPIGQPEPVQNQIEKEDDDSEED